jgi:uncharacterized protein YjiS (DUF1127 family)
MSFIAQIRHAAVKRAAYRRTVEELRTIPRHLADDVGIHPGDIERVAREVVYG